MLTPSIAIGLTALRRELDDLAASFTAQDPATSREYYLPRCLPTYLHAQCSYADARKKKKKKKLLPPIDFLRLHYHASIVAMHEPAIYARSPPPASSTMLALGPTGPQGLKRVDVLWHCLRAASDYADTYLELPAEIVGLQPLPHTALMTLSIMTATRMLFLQDADWDAIAARRVFDFAGVMSRITDLLAAAEAFEISRGTGATGLYRRRFQDDEYTPLISSHVAKLLWLRQWYVARTAPPGHNVAPPGDDPIPGEASPRHVEGEQTELQPQQSQKEAGAPPTDLPKTFPPPLGDPALGLASETPNPASTGFDISYLDTFDDSYWHAFMMDPQMGIPPLHMQIDPQA